jgi:iron(III) transport system substrate-binding protein
MKRIRTALATAVFALAFAAGAQAQWHTSPEVKALHEAAKKEGQVVFWGTQEREVKWIPQAFAEMFPGIAVKTLGENEIATKAIAEARAGRHEVDVFWHGYPAIGALIQRELLAKTDWKIFGLPPGDVVFDGRAGFTNTIAYAFAYNKDKVKPADLPKKWTDVLDPKYKGKMAASAFLLPFLVGNLGLVWDEPRAMQFARDLAEKSDMLLTRAPRESLLRSGERLYSVAEVESQVRLWAAEGNPIDFVIPDPAVVAPFGVAVMAKAPHPNAAKLLAGWIASKEGREARRKAVFSHDYRPGADDPEGKKLHASGVQVVVQQPEQADRRNEMARKAASILVQQTR